MASYSPTNLPPTKLSSNIIPQLNLMDFSFANNSGDSGYNSTNHQTTHEFNHKFVGSVLEKIDEDLEHKSINFSPLSSPLATPTTTSIKRMNALHLTSPKMEGVPLLRIPQKRSATKTQSENFQCTPKKSKVSGSNENKHKGVITPTHSFGGVGGNTNILLNDKIKSNGLNLTSSIIVNNILKEKSINRMPLTRSLSTSTPKFSPNFRVLDHQKNVPKSASPCKKKRILKKFQSFSPINYLKNSREAVVSPNNEVELVKKRLSFIPDRGENVVNRKRPKVTRQKVTIEESPLDLCIKSSGGAIKKICTEANSLKVITEERDSSFSLDLPRNATLENDCWRDFSFNNTLQIENSKFSNLINAPILNLGGENDIFHKPDDQKNQIDNKSQSPFTQLSSIEAADSLLSNFIENNSCEEVSVPSIHSYFDALKNTSLSLNHSNNSIKEKSLFNTTDSLELLSDKRTIEPEDILRSPKRRASISLADTFVTPKKINNDFNSVEYEKNLILHPKLPKTPPKKTKVLKRLNSTKFLLSDRKKIARTSYEGIDRLNILVHLENIKPALDIIFDNLNGEDLVRVSMVSKKWMFIVDCNSRAREKKLGYLKKAQPVKENIKKHKFYKAIIGKPVRPPFTLNNCSLKHRSRSQDDSPPLSPSKFNENQSLVKNLRKDSLLSRCPRCNSFCEVISPQVPTSPTCRNPPYKSPRKCLFSLQETPRNVKRASSFSALEKRIESATKYEVATRSNSWCPALKELNGRVNKSFFNISSNSSGSVSLFDSHSIIFPIISSDHSHLSESILVNANTAICHKCGFIFCNRCSNENHPNKNCSEIGSLSPERDDENRPIKPSVVGSKQSKRNLKRLCD